MKLTLSVADLSIIKWWVDASHLTHEDMKGHTGAMMSLGKGAVLSYSWKHKINVKSSTESELVGADLALPYAALWCLYFIEGQGYSVEQNIMFQDNQATMRLERRMDNSLRQNVPSTSRRDTSLSRTRSKKATLRCNTVRPSKCGQTC